MLSRMIPRLLTWGGGGGEIEELLMVRENTMVLDEVDLVPMRRTLVLLLFNLRMFKVNQIFSSEIQSVREVGRKVDKAVR